MLQLLDAEKRTWRATDLAWVAGIIDGEGTIFAHKTPRCTWQFGLEVSNTDTRMIQRLVDVSGGGSVNRVEAKPPRRRLWHWRISGHYGHEFICALQPHLVVKQDQLDLLIELIATGNWRGKHGVPREVIQRRMVIVQQLKNLRNAPCTQEVEL